MYLFVIFAVTICHFPIYSAREMSSQHKIFEDFQQGRMKPCYDHCYALLIAYAERFLGEREQFLAEDCVQEAIYKAYENRATMQNLVQLKSYVYSSVHNNAISLLRKSASHDAYLCNQKLESDDLAATLVMQDALEMLYNAVKNLPDELQHLFRLHIEDGLRLREVAEQLNLSASGVKKQKARMIRLLRKEMGGRDAMLLLLVLHGV